MYSKGNIMAVLLTLTLFFAVASSEQPALADWSISLHGSYRSPTTYYGDRVTVEQRLGYQVDDWIERGASSVTDSPLYSDGIRLAAWATRYEDDYEFGMASAIYYFEIPPEARSMKIKVYYDGEPDRDHLNSDIAGRVWIKRTSIDSDYQEYYYPDERRYDEMDQPLYGDTFVLPARKRIEIIRLSARDHVDDGIMELHVVAEGRQRIDVKRIEVETYTSLPSVRVITRYYKDYVWRPWYDYTYWYFYAGPVHHFSDYYYVRYTYPRYSYYYVKIRRDYNSYLRVYYTSRPHRYIRWNEVVRVRRDSHRSWNRSNLNRWTPVHDEVRRSYEITSMKTRREVDVKVSRERIRGVLSTDRQRSSVADRTSENRGSSITETKRGREASSVYQPSQQTRTSVPSTQERTPVRTERSDTTKTRRENVRSSTDTRSSIRSEQERTTTRQAPTVIEKREEEVEIKTRRDTESRRESKDSGSVRRAPSRSSSNDSKKDDDDDDDEEKKKRESSSGSSARKRIRSSR